jgi:hypothetical protein
MASLSASEAVEDCDGVVDDTKDLEKTEASVVKMETKGLKMAAIEVKREMEDRAIEELLRTMDRAAHREVEDDVQMDDDDLDAPMDDDDASEEDAVAPFQGGGVPRAKSWTGHCCRFSDVPRWVQSKELEAASDAADLSAFFMKFTSKLCRLPPWQRRTFPAEEETAEVWTVPGLGAAPGWSGLEPVQQDLYLLALKSCRGSFEKDDPLESLLAQRPAASRMTLPSDEDFIAANLSRALHTESQRH